MNDENKFDAEVADLARQLENTDFSGESQLKISLRAKLIQQAAKSTPRRKFSPVYTLAGVAAALLLVLIVVLAIPPAPQTATATTEPILTPTLAVLSVTSEKTQEMVVPTTLPDNQTGGFLATIPEGYVSHSTLVEPGDGIRLIHIYYQHDRWEEAVKSGDPYTDTVDYLYVILQPDAELPEADAGTMVPANTIVPPPDEVFATSSTYYDPIERDGQLIFTASGEGTLKDGRKVHYASRMDNNSLVQVWSFQLDAAILLAMLDRKTKQWEIGGWQALELDAPGSCVIFPDMSEPGEPGTNWFQSPLDAGYTLSAGFSETHTGLDLVAATGTPVTAAQAGRVVFAGQSNRGTGQTVILAHRNFYTLYAHLSEVKVACNEVVTTETIIGTVGSTGNASGPHLHFEVIDASGLPVDPTTVMEF